MWFESYAMVMAETKRKAEATADDAPRRISVADLAGRRAKVEKRLIEEMSKELRESLETEIRQELTQKVTEELKTANTGRRGETPAECTYSKTLLS